MSYSENGYPDVTVPELGRICEAIRGGRCIPFFGAGASLGYSFNGASAAGVPSGWQLTITLLREAGVAQDSEVRVLRDPDSADSPDELRAAMKLLDYDLFKAADYFLYKKNNRRTELDELLRREVAKAEGPRPIHTVIAQLDDIDTVLTTNYDCLFETACRKYGRKLFKHVHEQFRSNTGIWRGGPHRLRKPQINLHKMHGCVDRDESMIVTRADYIRYLANWRDPSKGMPPQFLGRLPTSTLLFLGYSLADWNLLTIWEGIVASYPQGGDEIQSFAVLKTVSEEDRHFLQKRNIEVIKCDLTEFAVALAREFELVIAELGLPKPPPDEGEQPSEKEDQPSPKEELPLDEGEPS